MSGPFGAQRVFPKSDPPAPTSPGAGGSPLAGLKRVDKKVWMGLGAVVVAGLALVLGRGEADGSGVDGSDPYELDTTTTDLFGELQPELESIGDGIDGIGNQLEDLTDDSDADVLGDTPSAATPAPAKAKKPRKNKASPKPNKGKPAAQGGRGKAPEAKWVPWRPGKGKGGKGNPPATVGTGPRRPAVQQGQATPRPAPKPRPNPVKKK